MKMIMNEYRLNLGQPKAQEFLLKQMEQYFFGKGFNRRNSSPTRHTKKLTGSTCALLTEPRPSEGRRSSLLFQPV